MIASGKFNRIRRPFVGVSLGLALVLGALLPALVPVALAIPIFTVDTDGADDEPGQKDLNFMVVEYDAAPGTIDVSWGWDDTASSGANTRDACALFDTDDDGFANFAYCVIVDADGNATDQLYVCNADNRSDRCAGPSAVNDTATFTAAVVANSDPFGVTTSPDFDPSHVSGNVCRDRPGCHTDDTVADTTINLSDLGNDTNPLLLNVCSYPSQQPNSDPSDCVLAPNSGFLTIVKDAGDDTSTDFTFNLAAGQTSADGTTSWTLTGSDTELLIPFIAGTYTLREAVPAGWSSTTPRASSRPIQPPPPERRTPRRHSARRTLELPA